MLSFCEGQNMARGAGRRRDVFRGMAVAVLTFASFASPRRDTKDVRRAAFVTQRDTNTQLFSKLLSG